MSLQTPDWQAVAGRIERLERENRRLKRACFVSVGLLVAAWMGLTVGFLKQRPSGAPAVLLDENGKPRVTLGMKVVGSRTGIDKSARLALMDEYGRVRVELGALDVGKVGLRISDEEGKARAELFISGDGPEDLRDRWSKTGLIFYDQAGKDRASLYVMTTGRPGLGLRDGENALRASLALSRDGSPYLSLGDEKGKERATLGHTELKLTQTEEVIQRPASSLVLFDKEGKLIWRAP